MKKTGFIIVYNDADYIEYTIQSVKDWVDELIIIEGAFEITMKTGKSARSTDGTLEIISKYVDNKRIFTKNVNLHEHKDHYDIGYQYAIENGSDWAIMVDSDEVWTKPAQTIADSFMKQWNERNSCEMRVNEFCYINDFNHYYKGTYPRIFKASQGSKFVYDNEVQFVGCARGNHPVVHIPGTYIHHYGYVRRKKRWEMKQDYMWEKDHNPILKTQYGLKENTYIIPQDLPVYEFKGRHPNIMENHPFYNKTAQEIIYGDE